MAANTPNSIAVNTPNYAQSGILAVSDFVRPDFKERLFNQFGDQFLKEYRLLEAMSSKRDVQNASGGFHFEEDRYDTRITVLANAGTSGSTLGFTLNSSMINDAGGIRTSYPNVGDEIFDPITMQRFRITAKTDNGTVTTITARETSGATAVVPSAGKVYGIYTNAYGENTDQPDARSSYWTKFTYKLQAIKTSAMVTGFAAGDKLFPLTDEMGNFVGNWGGVQRTQAEFRHLKALVGAMVLGKETTASGLATTTNGMMEVFSTRAVGVDISGGVDIDSIKTLVDSLIPNSPRSNNYIGLIGRNLINPFQESLQTLLQNANVVQTAKSSAEMIFGAGAASENMYTTFDFNAVTVNGFTINFRNFNISFDPEVFGVGDPATNQFANTAYFLPSEQAVDVQGAMRRHIEMNVLSNPEGGVNRRLKIWETGANAPTPTNGVDNRVTNYLTHAGFDYFALKQCGYFFDSSLS